MKPGQTTDYVVHVRGEVTERTETTMTVAGWVLPVVLGEGVLTLSTVWPESARVSRLPCDRDHCGDGDCDDWDCDRDHCEDHDNRPDYGDQGDVIDAAQKAHDLVHEAPWLFCPDALCSAVRRAAAVNGDGSPSAWPGNGRTGQRT